MQYCQALVLILVFLMLPIPGYAQASCFAPPLSDQEIKVIIGKERAVRTDLPPPFPKYRGVVKKEGCHYLYIEYGLPETPEYYNTIRLNQYGVIVDADTNNLKCPEKVFSENELAEIVKKAREQRKDLPPPFPKYKARVERIRCLYVYLESDLPETKGSYQGFTIDPFGELMDFSHSGPN